MKWDEMADLPDGSGKHCAHCQRSVLTVRTRRQFNAAARRGDCVAVFPEGEEELPPLSGAPEEPGKLRLLGDPVEGRSKHQRSAARKSRGKGD
jgi:hypothetical protein